ncbi:FkbM family methyltransferase [filamentous cyanobacterium LEGE 11480]|uniref:FkbM family methyltransferase n=1 Tax=Romeriopsis navalis LEGE 11480 TaxID=2777977 RepID=A0A928Z135_9CYAN|nr:FkbM family methyltransferase [Romeriopsis navalis]MBE9028906.1 FkbM family methyltransferase [Romeriopsis navalis LEGE 11480]
MNSLMTNAALWLHIQHSKTYSYYKFQKSQATVSEPLTAEEREFYLKLQSTLQGEDLVVYDIGAAKGIVSACLEKLANVASIQAFEPIPDVYQALQARFATSKKVKCHNVALGNETGVALMNISHRSDSSSLLPIASLHSDEFPGTEARTQIKVPVLCLDDYIKQNNLPQPDVVKIDVQGFEEKVISGGLETMAHAKYCVLEMSFKHLYEGSPLFDDIYQLMRKLNFRLVGMTDPLTGASGEQFQVDGIFERQTD